ncbi:MAG TPA: amidohydrolase family protein [Steroidobacteraceae bacterium]|jgi:imidazolonepropionase-like amidohydrolase|nr:amidohydrolase family protein [Steroidobacteraceae bacterium]
MTATLTLRVVPALTALLVCQAAAVAAAPEAKVVVYRGAALIDGTGAPPRNDRVIVTTGERITAVVPAAGFSVPAGAEVVELRGKFLVPGFVNTHVHLATLAEPAHARAYLRRELYSGVTALRDMAGDVRLLAELKREAEFNEIPSPDIYYVALMAGPEFFADPRTHDAARGRIAGEVPWMQALTPQTDLPLAVAAARGTGATALKLYADLPAPLVRAVTAEAHRQHLLVWAHATIFPAGPLDEVDAGIDVLSHAALLGYALESSIPPRYRHGALPLEVAPLLERPDARLTALFADMRRHGTILDATLYPYDSGAAAQRSKGLADRLADLAYRAGVAISTGTDDDGDLARPDSPLLEEFALLVQRAGVHLPDLVTAATRIGARAAGQERDMGTIEPGKLADFVVLDRDPLADVANLSSVALTVKRGIRYPHRDYRPVTEAEVKSGT